MKYADAISPLAMNAAMPVKRPMAMRNPVTISIPPAAFINGGNGPFIPGGIGGYPSSFCVPWIANMSPAMIRSNANVCAEKRPITSAILHLRRRRRSRRAPAGRDDCSAQPRRTTYAHPRSHQHHRHSASLHGVQPEAGRNDDRFYRHHPTDFDRYDRDRDWYRRAGDEQRHDLERQRGRQRRNGDEHDIDQRHFSNWNDVDVG